MIANGIHHLDDGSLDFIECQASLLSLIKVGILHVERQNFVPIDTRILTRTVRVILIIGIPIHIEPVGFIVVGIHFQQHGVGFIIQVDAVARNTHFWREHIIASIVIVDIEIHGRHLVGSLGSHKSGNLHTHGIGNHGIILFVGQQHPTLTLRHAERFLSLFKLQAIGVLGVFAPRNAVIPTGVSTALNRHGHLCEIIEYAGTVDANGGIIILILTVCTNHFPVECIDVNLGHAVSVGEPGEIGRIIVTQREHAGFHHLFRNEITRSHRLRIILHNTINGKFCQHEIIQVSSLL